MLKKLVDKINNIESLLKASEDNNYNKTNMEKVEIPKSLDEIKKRLEDLFSNCSDFISREVSFGINGEFKIILAYMGGLCVKEAISEQILKPLMVELKETNVGHKINNENIVDILKNNLLISSELDEVDDFNKSVESILCGDTVIYFHGKNKAIKVDIKGWSGRNVGEASVSAGLIGAPMVVIVALTAITSFTVPALSDVNAVLRLTLIFVAAFTGIYGIVLIGGVVMFHVCSLRSFGVNYTAPIAPRIYSDLKDSFIRLPWYTMLNRPRCLNGENIKRMKQGQIPKSNFNKKENS